MRLFLIVLFIACLASGVQGVKKFNYYKSYKNSNSKPKNYGTKIQRDHPITDYLTNEQLVMLKRRKGTDQDGFTFDENWDGKDPKRRLLAPDSATDGFPFLRNVDLEPPEAFTYLWWQYIGLLLSIGVVALGMAWMLGSLCFLAVRPRKSSDADEEVSRQLEFECLQGKDMDA